MTAVAVSSKAAPAAKPKPFNFVFILNSWSFEEMLRKTAGADQ
jgi:hypothetical protein